MPKVALVMGSESDLSVLTPAISTLKRFGVELVVRVLSAHRTPAAAAEFAKTAEEQGIEVIIAAAGKAAHLPGVLAAYTVLPVIGVPVQSSALDGMDALLSIVQMPTGIPVATVAINGAQNAALLATQILSVRYSALRGALRGHRASMTAQVEESDKRVAQEVSSIE